jgi:hypothetical protein
MFDTVLTVSLQADDRRAAAYLLLATRVIALAPMAIFLADRARFVSLASSKLAATLSFPAPLVGVASTSASARMLRWSDASSALSCWRASRWQSAKCSRCGRFGNGSSAGCCGSSDSTAALALMFLFDLGEWLTSQKKHRLGPDAASVNELRDLARAAGSVQRLASQQGGRVEGAVIVNSMLVSLGQREGQLARVHMNQAARAQMLEQVHPPRVG